MPSLPFVTAMVRQRGVAAPAVAPAVLIWFSTCAIARAEDGPEKPPSSADAKRSRSKVELTRVLSADELCHDLNQFRAILKRDWILANLNDTDFDTAVDQIERESAGGITVADLTLGLHRVLCLGADGHALASQTISAVKTVEGVYQDFRSTSAANATSPTGSSR